MKVRPARALWARQQRRPGAGFPEPRPCIKGNQAFEARLMDPHMSMPDLRYSSCVRLHVYVLAPTHAGVYCCSK